MHIILSKKIVIRTFKRLRSSIPENVLSNYAKIYLERAKVQEFVSFMKNNKIKCVKMDYLEEKGHFWTEFFLSDVESFNKTYNTREILSTFKTASFDDGSVSTPNRMTILHEDELCEEIKSLIPKESFISTKLPHKRFYHIYCQTEDQFNSLFFQNGIQKNVSIERTHFPYIKNMTLKISPNIINVYFPEEIVSEERASKFFSDLRFNKIVKPSNPKAPWKFYLSNEEDYLKMLSQPYFYMNQCLLILPYYGSPGYLYDGEKKVGNSLLIYSNNKIGKLGEGLINPLYHEKSLYENGYIASFFGNKTKLNKLRFLNGAKLGDDKQDFTMMFGDEINKFNIVSPYLKVIVSLDSDTSLIQSKLAPFIYDSKIEVLPAVKFLKILPLSFEHYRQLLTFSFEVDGSPLKIYPIMNLCLYSYFSTFISIPKNIYEENEEEIEKSMKPTAIIPNKRGFLLAYNNSEISDALFKLARYDNFKGNIHRKSTPLIDSYFSSASNKVITISGKYLDLAESNCFERQPHEIIKITENRWLIIFKRIEHAFPYLFSQIIDINNNKVEFQRSFKKNALTSSLDSRLTAEATIKLLNFYGIKYIIDDDARKGRFQLKMETLDDLYNIMSIADELENDIVPDLRFNPGYELNKL